MDSADLRSEYCQKGLVHLPGFFSSQEVQAIRFEAQAIFIRQLLAKDLVPSGELDELALADGMERLFRECLPTFINCGKQAQHLISLHRLSLDERITETLRRLGLSSPNISTRPVLFFNSPRLATKQVYWKVMPHQDWRSMQGSLDAVVVWLPLIDIPPQLGPLEVVLGSHREGLISDTVVEGFGQVPDEYVATHEFVPLECRLGDAVFFSAFLVHRSGTNVSSAIRWSCHFRYNNLAEPTFIERGYPHPYVYKPQDELITSDFPTRAQVASIFA